MLPDKVLMQPKEKKKSIHLPRQRLETIHPGHLINMPFYHIPSYMNFYLYSKNKYEFKNKYEYESNELHNSHTK